MEKQKPKVRVFTTVACSFCLVLKQFLKDHNIEFEEIDVSQDKKAREEMIKKSGQMEIPVVEINGEIVIGFDIKKITQLLNIQK